IPSRVDHFAAAGWVTLKAPPTLRADELHPLGVGVANEDRVTSLDEESRVGCGHQRLVVDEQHEAQRSMGRCVGGHVVVSSGRTSPACPRPCAGSGSGGGRLSAPMKGVGLRAAPPPRQRRQRSTSSMMTSVLVQVSFRTSAPSRPCWMSPPACSPRVTKTSRLTRGCATRSSRAGERRGGEAGVAYGSIEGGQKNE